MKYSVPRLERGRAKYASLDRSLTLATCKVIGRLAVTRIAVNTEDRDSHSRILSSVKYCN